MELAFEQSVKHNGQPISTFSNLNETIVRLYHESLQQNPKIALIDITLHIAKTLQIGMSTVKNILQNVAVINQSKFRPKKGQDVPVIPNQITTSHQELEIKPLEFVEVEDFTASTNGESLEHPSPSTITTNPPPDTSMVVVQPSSSQMEHGIKRKVDPPTTNPTAKKLHQTSDNSSAPEDEYELFCRSLICQLRNMPVDRAVICQEKLQSVMTQERLYQMGINYEQKSEPTVYDNIIVKEETDIDANSGEY